LRAVKRIAALGCVAAAVAAGLALTGAVPALAATNPTTFAVGPTGTHAGCDVTLFYARVSSSTPADVSADTDSTHPGHPCTVWVERSTAGTTKWMLASAKVALPSVSGLQGVANTGLVYDGPGYKARACVQPGSSAAFCTSSMSLAKGSGTATSPALPASYTRKLASVFRTTSAGIAGVCAAGLASSTTSAAKKAGATVVGLLASDGDPCTAWIQSTANNGKTWTTVSPVISFKAPSSTRSAAAFTAHYADGPGHLARICVKDTLSKQADCSNGW
jgi:hypothetical protein